MKMNKDNCYEILKHKGATTVHFNEDLARIVGIHGAIIYEKMRLSRINGEEKIMLNDGNYTEDFFRIIFPYFSDGRLRKGLHYLEDYGVIKKIKKKLFKK